MRDFCKCENPRSVPRFETKDVDLFLVDSEDLHDGTISAGLSDAYSPGGVDAHKSNQFLSHLPYDIMEIGP
ncbi:hypothetical protein ID866_8585 [Astraeus odoratus]|nr:hypothetical protein ID866_8585 [Astraeus odoratus]